MTPKSTDTNIMRLIHQLIIIDNEGDLDAILNDITHPTSPITIGFLNAHALNMCYRNPDFLDHLLQCDHLFRDGIGIKILLKILGRDAGYNLNGTDFIPQILDKVAGKTINLYGTQNPYLEKAASIIQNKNIDVIKVMDGFQNNDAYPINHADIYLLAMGMPKQERIAIQIKNKSTAPALIICGGAILDFISGKVTRAPAIFRKCGMEWLYRLILEPKRLFKRYIIGNFVMMWHAIRLKLRTL